jgi:pimeloyl-ACP methyl ester carboxylesterase
VTLLLLHAFPLDGRMWDPLGREDAIAPRLYGPGSSMGEWADALLEQIEGPFLACGSSMGGYCALAIAHRAPERLTGLVLTGARLDGDPEERRSGRAATIDLIRSQGPAGLWEDMRPKLFSDSAPADLVAQTRAIALEQDPEDLVRGIEAIRDRPDSTAAVLALDVPVVLAIGEHDTFFAPDEAHATGLPVRIFSGVGHLPPLERPDEFNALLDGLA